MRLPHILAAALIAVTITVGAHAEAVPPLVEASWLKARLGSADLRILDIRNAFGHADRQTYEAAHIPGAVYSNYLTDAWHDRHSEIPATLPPIAELEALLGRLGIGNGELVVVVHSGTDSSDFSSAARVFWTLRMLGHQRVAILDGGHRAWNAAGYDTEPGWREPHPTAYHAKPRDDLLSTTGEVVAALRNGAQLVDARTIDFFEGRRKAGVTARAGTLPTALHLAHRDLIDPKTGKFIPTDMLRDRIVAAGLLSERATVTFCNIGHWSAAVWFALHVQAGFRDVSLYDGSMAEWTLDPERPVAMGNAQPSVTEGNR